MTDKQKSLLLNNPYGDTHGCLWEHQEEQDDESQHQGEQIQSFNDFIRGLNMPATELDSLSGTEEEALEHRKRQAEERLLERK